MPVVQSLNQPSIKPLPLESPVSARACWHSRVGIVGHGVAQPIVVPSRLARLATSTPLARPLGWSGPRTGLVPSAASLVAVTPHRDEVDPLYLFACHAEWEQRNEPTSAWELIAAAQSSSEDTRAQARALLSNSRHLPAGSQERKTESLEKAPRYAAMEANMKGPYGLEIVENCTNCSCRKTGFMCSFSPATLDALDQASHLSTLPAGAILFVEGQMPRGMFILCSGKVNLSTTSREGKVLILKTAEAGEALGLSAAISGLNYEMTAETATPCHLNFVNRKNLLELLRTHSEMGLHAAQCLSRDFQVAYRDVHDLVLARSSAGKLARLLLSCSPQAVESDEVRLRSIMTHEEMAQRIGSSRETVTRLLSDLKKKHLIRLEGSTLVIRNRIALEALAV